MKNTVKILIILLVSSFLFSSCDNDIMDVEFSTTLSEKIAVHFNENIDQETIDNTIIVNLDNTDTHDYLSKIKNISISKLTFKIVDFTGDDVTNISNTDLYVDNIILFNNLSITIKEAFDNQTIYEVTDTNKLNQVAQLIKTNNQITAGITGDYQSYAAANFKVEVTLKLDITANPL